VTHGPASILCGLALAVLACAPSVTVRPGGEAALTLFRVRVKASRVEIAGAMTDWRARPLRRVEGGFELELKLPPGRYEYRLTVMDSSGIHEVFPEEGERTPDGFGGENAVLRVR